MNGFFCQLHIIKTYFCVLNNIFIMIGPEGGFTSQEIEKAKACGFITAALGPSILRAETATIAASVLIQYLFGDIGIKNS